MFDNLIDVSAIMRAIKENVINDNEKQLSNELWHTTTFIANTRTDTSMHIHIGSVLPQAVKYPRFIQKIIRLISRVIRKFSKFILNDQIIVNTNVDACIQELVERDDLIVKYLSNTLGQLETRVKTLTRELDAVKRENAELQKELDTLRINTFSEEVI